MTYMIQLHYFACGFPFVSAPFVEKFFHCLIIFVPFSKSIDHRGEDLFLDSSVPLVSIVYS